MTAQPRADDYGGHAVLLDWETQFIPWLGGRLRKATVGGVTMPLPSGWKPGEHWALCGPTGEGKSTFGVGIIGTRNWVVALDPKGEDETLAAAGYTRAAKIPLPRDRLAGVKKEPREGTDDWVWHRVERGLPVGLAVGFEAMTDEADAALRELMGDAINWVKRTRGWTLYIDEFEMVGSPQMMRQGGRVSNMLIAARHAGTSVVTAFQAPAWVPRHATRQARKATIFPTRDRDMIKALAQSFGRDWRMLARVVDELPPFHSVTLTNQIRRPMIVTVAPKIS
jgi:hypothetical protein